MMWWCMAAAFGWDERGPQGVATGRELAPHELFVPQLPAWSSARVVTAPLDLGLVAMHTADTLRRLRARDSPLATTGMLAELDVSLDDVLRTLDLVARTAFEDRGALHQRLHDPSWLASHFEVLRWLPDVDASVERKIRVEPDQLRLTKYVVYRVEGSTRRTSRFDTALYAVPSDEADGAPGVRHELTRMDVYAGAFEPGGRAAGLAEPLVWLTRDGSNQALLQGTIEVRLPDGRAPLYNVHRNNGLPWEPSVKDLDLQPRFWYFREVEQILGLEGTPLRPAAAVAGDVFNVGLGKLLALEWPGEHGPELRLVILADTGGAFQPNLFQLDYLAGTFPDRAAYDDYARDTPTHVPVSLLVASP